MYEDEYFQPTNCADYATYDYANEDSESNTLNTDLLRQMDDKIKRADRGYHKFVRPFGKVWTDGKFYKKFTIECFETGDTGSQIRDAITGQRNTYLRGAMQEDLFFSVTIASGENKRRHEPIRLYYSSPEEYEKHQYASVSADVKNKWQAKNQIARKTFLNQSSPVTVGDIITVK